MKSKNKFKARRNSKLKLLATDVNFKLLHARCSIAHALTQPDTSYRYSESLEVKLDDSLELKFN